MVQLSEIKHLRCKKWSKYAISNLFYNVLLFSVDLYSSEVRLLIKKLVHIFVQATKAAVISFFQTLRIEVGSEIGITIVTPGLVDSELTDGDFMSKVSFPKTLLRIHCNDLLKFVDNVFDMDFTKSLLLKSGSCEYCTIGVCGRVCRSHSEWYQAWR